MEIGCKRCFQLAGHTKSFGCYAANEAGSWRVFIQPNENSFFEKVILLLNTFILVHTPGIYISNN